MGLVKRVPGALDFFPQNDLTWARRSGLCRRSDSDGSKQHPRHFLMLAKGHIGIAIQGFAKLWFHRAEGLLSCRSLRNFNVVWGCTASETILPVFSADNGKWQVYSRVRGPLTVCAIESLT